MPGSSSIFWVVFTSEPPKRSPSSRKTALFCFSETRSHYVDLGWPQNFSGSAPATKCRGMCWVG